MANILKNVQDLCSPALTFLILAIILNIISYSKGYMTTPTSIIMPIILVAATTFIMNKLCSSGYKIVAWAILILLLFFAPSPVGLTVDFTINGLN
jgi:hypothetical protein